MMARSCLLMLFGSWCIAHPVYGLDKSNQTFIASDLAGWQGLIADHWSYKDGALIGVAPHGLKFNTFLCSKQKHGDFELKFQVWLIGANANSGVQIRSEIFDAKHFAVRGPQCDMGQVYWASLYGEHFGGAQDKNGLAAGGMMKQRRPKASNACFGQTALMTTTSSASATTSPSS